MRNNLSFIFAAALMLTACTTNGAFDPVKTQASAHGAHAAAALGLKVSAQTGVLKGKAAADAIVANDAAEDAIVAGDAALGVSGDPEVQAAADADAKATDDADVALKAASRR